MVREYKARSSTSVNSVRWDGNNQEEMVKVIPGSVCRVEEDRRLIITTPQGQVYELSIGECLHCHEPG